MATTFPLGMCVMTCGARDALPPWFIADSFARHAAGDWGTLCDEDRKANEDALKHGDRILSKYNFEGEDLYVLTEADRSITTALLTSEY